MSYYKDGGLGCKGLFQWTGVRGGHNETTVFLALNLGQFFQGTIFVSEKASADVLVFRLTIS
jgi:hypothetical protein